MKTIPDAYTVGNPFSYNKALKEEPIIEKLGRYMDINGEYLGGIVFKTKELAQIWLKENLEFKYEIYGLILYNGWDIDVQEKMNNETFHRLLNNAKIIGIE